MATPIGVDPTIRPFQALLVAIPALTELPLQEVKRLLDKAVHREPFAPRKEIFGQDWQVAYVYYLQEGRVIQDRTGRDAQGRPYTTLRRERGPGALLGISDLVYGQLYSVRTRTLTPCVTLAIEASALNRVVSRFPTLRQQLLPYHKIGRLRTIPFLGDVDLTTLSFLADDCQSLELPADHVIYHPGEQAGYLYFVDTGQVELTMADNEVVWLGNGGAFGYVQQRRNVPARGIAIYDHQATTRSPCTILQVSRKVFVDITGINPERLGLRLQPERKDAIRALQLFQQLTAEEQSRLLGYASHYHMPARRTLFQPGKLGDSLWILMPGRSAVVTAEGEAGQMQTRRVTGPNCFGEVALLGQHVMLGGLHSDADSQWLRIHWQDFEQFLKHEANPPDLRERLDFSPETLRELATSRKVKKRFSWLREDEHVELIQRRHWLAFLSKILPGIVLAVILIPIGLLLSWLLADNVAAQGLVWAVIAIAILVVLAWGAGDYWNDFFVVTNRRVIHQEKVLYVTEWRQEAPLEQVQNIDTSRTFWGNVFGFGDLNVQTAATTGALRFGYMPSPEAMRTRILSLRGGQWEYQQTEGLEIITDRLEQELGLPLQLPEHVLPEPPSTPPPAASQRRGWLRWPAKKAPYPPTEDSSTHFVWRKHWFILLGQLAVPILLLTAITIFLLLEGVGFLGRMAALNSVLTLLAAMAGIAVLCWVAWIITDWHNDTYELTDERIMDVYKKPLFFAENRRTAELERIQNIDVEIPSPLHYVLDFGKVKIQTAATDGDFTFDWVPDPRAVAAEIERRRDHSRQQRDKKAAEKRVQELQHLFQLYDSLRQR